MFSFPFISISILQILVRHQLANLGQREATFSLFLTGRNKETRHTIEPTARPDIT